MSGCRWAKAPHMLKKSSGQRLGRPLCSGVELECHIVTSTSKIARRSVVQWGRGVGIYNTAVVR